MTSLAEQIKTKKVKAEKAAAEQKPSRLIYIGPNLPQYALFTGRVYIGGLPETAKPAIEKWSLFRQFFVEPAKMSATQAAMKTKGTPQNEALRQLGRG